MPDRTAIYIRETHVPDPARLQELQRAAADHGMTVASVHIDRAGSLSRSRKRLPALAALIADVERGAVDSVLVSSVAQLGTSVDSLIDTLATMCGAGVRLTVLDQADAAECTGAGLLASAQMLAAARKEYRREATVAGQMKARAVGVRFGRPPISVSRIEKVKLVLAQGVGVRQAARKCGVSAATVSGIRSQMKSAAQPTSANQ